MKVRAVLVILFALSACMANAQTTVTPNFTVNPAPSGGGLVFISEAGTVSYCTSWITVQGIGKVAGLTPSGACAAIGKVALPVANWVGYPQGQYSVILLNTASGAIVQCAVGSGGPANSSALGSCKELGAVSK